MREKFAVDEILKQTFASVVRDFIIIFVRASAALFALHEVNENQKIFFCTFFFSVCIFFAVCFATTSTSAFPAAHFSILHKGNFHHFSHSFASVVSCVVCVAFSERLSNTFFSRSFLYFILCMHTRHVKHWMGSQNPPKPSLHESQ